MTYQVIMTPNVAIVVAEFDTIEDADKYASKLKKHDKRNKYYVFQDTTENIKTSAE